MTEPRLSERKSLRTGHAVKQEAPDCILAERQRRLMTPPRDLTAALLGDPPPGYSALEAKR
jgi:hypothetical protein